MTVRTHGLPPSAAKLLRAVVVRDVATVSDPLLVRIESFGPAASEAAAWPSIYPLPKVGDVALALVDETGVPWIQGFERKGTLETAGVLAALPSEPFDGQIVNFQSTAMAAEGVVWRLRYRAASASSHKWEFIGGSEIVAQVAEQRGPKNIEAGEVNKWISLGGPKLAIPLAGDYDVRSESSLYYTTGGALLYQGINSVIADTYQVAVAGSWYVSNGSIRTAGLVIGTLEQQYQSASTGVLYANASRIAARPVRVG